MIPETNHDVEISIYYDFLEDQGIYVDRDEEEYYYYYENRADGVGFSSIVGQGVGGSSMIGDKPGTNILSPQVGGRQHDWSLICIKGGRVGGQVN